MNARTVAWEPLDGQGFQLVNLRTDERRSVMINGECLWVHEGEPFAAHYTIHCHPSWDINEVSFGVRRFEGALISPAIILARSRDGQWVNHRNAPQPVFQGFSDVDISITPLTNTLAIRRLNLQVGESRDINVVYFEAPSLEPKPTRQRYSCLGKYSDGELYRFQSLDTGFTADISVDTDGLVLEYPGLFKRVWEK